MPERSYLIPESALREVSMLVFDNGQPCLKNGLEPISIEHYDPVAEKSQLLVLLRCLARGHTEVLFHNGRYVNIECVDWGCYRDAKTMAIIDCLQRELYGDTPLTGLDEADWNKIKQLLAP